MQKIILRLVPVSSKGKENVRTSFEGLHLFPENANSNQPAWTFSLSLIKITSFLNFLPALTSMHVTLEYYIGTSPIAGMAQWIKIPAQL